ncbi:MAG: hypothetical protein SGJ17_13640 [Hyphomicrobiales bacterium]|nr:hypothetical protein [Hyphomicrobiales bacterium]
MQDIQPWLSVAGITIDLIGFCILLWEWWLAFFNEENQLGFQRRLEAERNRRVFAQSTATGQLRDHMERSGKMMDDMALRRAWEDYANTLRRRKLAFILATMLIISGALLQIAGAWPF